MARLDLEQIINQDDLNDFILNRGEYFKPMRGDDYQDWNKLTKYYNSKDASPQLKGKIEVAILNLFDSQDEEACRAALSLSRVLHIQGIKEKIILFLLNNRLEKLDAHLQDHLLITMAFFRIKELEDQLILSVVKGK